MMSRTLRIIVFAVVALCVHTSATAQWVEQTIHLRPGWNAVFFEVQPQPNDCNSVFQGIPIESVWAWNRRFTTVEFVQDPNTLVPEQPEWLTWFPRSSPHAFVANLFKIWGGRAYLVKLGGTAPADLVVRGRPRLRDAKWMSDSFNFVGFHVDAASPPTFAQYFAPSTAHAGQAIYRMGAGGRWQEVTNPATGTMRRGEAYWVYCTGQSTYQGPLSVEFDVGDGLDYARVLIERNLEFRNVSGSPRTVQLKLRSSAAPPSDPEFALLAGDVPLAHFVNDIPNQRYGWEPLPTPFDVTVPAGDKATVRLAVQRRAMADFTHPPDREALYQSLLEVTDGAGVQLLVPVSAKGLNAPRVSRSAIRRSALGGAGRLRQANAPNYTGLWVGNVTISAVSNTTSGVLNPTQPLPVAAELMYRLIVHVDDTGQSRLLQQVIQMWRNPEYIMNPDDPTSQTRIIDPNNPGSVVLLTSDTLVSSYTGVALHNSQSVGRRISTAAFGLREPLPMTGDFGSTVASPALTCSVVIPYDHPTNPFLHRYHPDHNNLDERGNPLQSWDPRAESFTVRRDVELHFTDNDPEDRVTAEWNDTQRGGFYNEIYRGIHRSDIYTSGTFRMVRVSDVGVLNDGQ